MFLKYLATHNLSVVLAVPLGECCPFRLWAGGSARGRFKWLFANLQLLAAAKVKTISVLLQEQAGAGAAASALNSYPSGTYCCATCNLGCSVHIITPIPQSLLKHLWCASFAGLLKIIHQISLLCPRLITNNWCYCTSRYLCFLVTERKKCDFQLLRELSYWLLSNARAITCYFF